MSHTVHSCCTCCEKWMSTLTPTLILTLTLALSVPRPVGYWAEIFNNCKYNFRTFVTIFCTSLMQKWWKMEEAKVGTRQYLHSRICSVLCAYNQWFIPTLHQVLETNPRQRWLHWWYRSPPKDAASGRWELFCGEIITISVSGSVHCVPDFLHIFLWLIPLPFFLLIGHILKTLFRQ